jgi:hypothetical protein
MSRVIVVSLDVTVSRESWAVTYGTDPVEDLPEYVAAIAASASQLRALDGNGLDGVPYRVLGSEDKTHPAVAARGFVTVRVAVSLTVNADQVWEATYGLPAVDAVAAHAAVEVFNHRPMREEVSGTVQVVPYSAGWIIGEGAMRGGRPQ